ncbi:hypothetical protein XENOCAPTIV_020216 [Xenoophorus captivus]|uniref:Uncharacterized protein n=1 Tax=Xenoophorus captivus TaxID=1517983 RepID=A0ABV0REV2_9TELE
MSFSQPEEEEFNGHAWTALKAEMGLDERNPKCFLHTYSVVMVLRKVTSRDEKPKMRSAANRLLYFLSVLLDLN